MTQPDETLRERIIRLRKANPALARRIGAQIRAAAVVEHFDRIKARNPGDPYVAHRGVTFYSVTLLDNTGVEIQTGPDEIENHFRIFNPPTLVRDGAGDVELEGRRHRQDPLGAVAQVILDTRREKSRATKARNGAL